MAVEVGFAVPVSGAWATPENQRRVAQRAEELGYHSLWTFQRLLWPAGVEGERAAPYRAVLDPIASLGFVAAVTERVRLGVAVVNAPFVAPALLAKQLATVDVLSGGRLVAGLGLGWMEQEHVATGVPMTRRGARLEENLRCLYALWEQDPVEFHGEFYEVPPTHADPKPVQRPRPPVVLGGAAEPALRRAGRLADGWVSASRADLRALAAGFDVVRAGAREAGRDPAALRLVVRGSVKLRRERTDTPLTGPVEQVRDDIAAIAAQGATELFVDLNFDPEVPGMEPAAAMRRAEEALEAFAPGA